MGLDMYAYATSEPITAQADFKPDGQGSESAWQPRLFG